MMPRDSLRHMQDFIISEIKRLAAETGAPPGQDAFTSATGITPAKWRGVIWLRWSDALAEAGFAANEWNKRRDSREILEHVATLCRKLGRLPTRTEIKMQKRSDPAFPAHTTVSNHYRTNADLASALRKLSIDPGWIDLASVVPEERAEEMTRPGNQEEGVVYLLKSGKHSKSGGAATSSAAFVRSRSRCPKQ